MLARGLRRIAGRQQRYDRHSRPCNLRVDWGQRCSLISRCDRRGDLSRERSIGRQRFRESQHLNRIVARREKDQHIGDFGSPGRGATY